MVLESFFPDDPWFDVSSAIIERGFASMMTGAMVTRYFAFRFLANSKRGNSFQATLSELERIDGNSPRRTHEVHAMLEEMRMVIVEHDCKPYHYALLLPSEWIPPPPRTKGKRETDAKESSLVSW